MLEFELAGNEFIELTKLLKALGLVETGGEAKVRIENGEVKVNGLVEIQKRKKLRSGDKVSFGGKNVIIR